LYLEKSSHDEHRIQIKKKMEQLKDIARTFNKKGIWIFTPHQISRRGKSAAEKRGYYNLDDLSESSGVEQTANLCGWCLRTEDLKEEGKLRIGINKYRTGSIDPKGVELMADFAHGLIDEVEEYNDDLDTL